MFTSPLHTAQRLVQTGADLLFPPTCVVCQRPGSLICPVCAQTAEPVGELICTQCGRRQPRAVARCILCQLEEQTPLRLARAAAIHHGPVREGIHVLKYGGKAEIAPLLARYLVAAFAQSPWPHLRSQINGVTPVPLHPDRLRERGYNQAELLAQAFCQVIGLPLRPHWLQRQRFTQSQVGLTAMERRENVVDAFVATPDVRGRTLLLMDDVYTTGATLHACATAALHAGAYQVFALALASPDHLRPETTDQA
jgi:ComF family protein